MYYGHRISAFQHVTHRWRRHPSQQPIGIITIDGRISSGPGNGGKETSGLILHYRAAALTRQQATKGKGKDDHGSPRIRKGNGHENKGGGGHGKGNSNLWQEEDDDDNDDDAQEYQPPAKRGSLSLMDECRQGAIINKLAKEGFLRQAVRLLATIEHPHATLVRSVLMSCLNKGDLPLALAVLKMPNVTPSVQMYTLTIKICHRLNRWFEVSEGGG